jgi:hypothetical protein
MGGLPEQFVGTPALGDDVGLLGEPTGYFIAYGPRLPDALYGGIERQVQGNRFQ